MSRLFLLFILCSVLCSVCAAAANDNQTFLLAKVSSTGSKRFSEAEIIRATGLKTGSMVTVDEVKRAAARLSETGVFSQVGFRYDGRSAEYTVVDAQQLVPVTFENFIWFSDAELLERLQKTVPLFAGNLPLNGNLGDQVSAALDAILKEKSIPGRVVVTPQAKLGGPTQSMQFQIDGLNVKIAEVRFPGAAPDHVPLLQKVTDRIMTESYSQTFFADVIHQNVPPIYGKLGYLKAQFGTPKTIILQNDPAQPVIAVEVPIQEGDQYTFVSANWNGVKSIPVAELTKLVDLKPGAPADTIQLGIDIAATKELYGTRGYMFVQVKSTATLDAEKHTAIFNLDVNEGPLYHMGKLEIQAPDPERAELVRRIWGMHEGDVYDSSYVKNFLKKHPRELSSLDGWAAHYTQKIHDDTHVVDLSLKFERFQREAR
jgi:outer membrane protein insertion porin family